MVSQTNESDRRVRFVIRPNRSLTWRQQKRFFALMTCVMMGIAAAFATLGFWPILPFAGLELAVLGAALWMRAAAGLETEVVCVDPHWVAVDKGRQQTTRIWEAQTPWAQIRLQPSRIRWYPSRLVLRSHGTEVQLATFLTDKERRHLAGELERAIEATAR